MRQSSQNDLVTVVGAFPACRALFAADVVKPLDMNESHVTHEQLKVNDLLTCVQTKIGVSVFEYSVHLP